MDLIKKHEPGCLDDFVGNYACVRTLARLMADPSTTCICVLGPSGSGKSVLSRLVTDSLHVFARPATSVTSSDFVASVRDFVLNHTGAVDFFAPVSSRKVRRKAVIFDDMDTYDRASLAQITLLMSTVIKHANVLVVGTCNSNDDRRIADFKKAATAVVNVAYPSQREAFRYLLSLDIDCDDARMRTLVDIHNGNIREVFLNIAVHSSESGQHFDLFKDSNIFETVDRLFQTPVLSVADMVDSIHEDVAATTYMIYENMPDRMTHGECMDAYLRINDIFVSSCILDRYVTSHMEWSLTQVSDALKFAGIHEALDRWVGDRATTGARHAPTLRFSQILSKVSHKNMMHIKMAAIATRLNVSIGAVLTLCDCGPPGTCDFSKEETGVVTMYRKYLVS